MLVAVLLGASCDMQTYTEREPGIPLMLDKFVSYSTEQEVRAALDPTPVLDLERSKPEPGDDKLPPRVIARLGVSRFEHLGATGELHLLFFNDRLQSAWFFPDDFTAYLDQVKSRGVTISDDLADSGRALLDVSTGQTDGKHYVEWADSRLIEQHTRWILRYALSD